MKLIELIYRRFLLILLIIGSISICNCSDNETISVVEIIEEIELAKAQMNSLLNIPTLSLFR